VQLGRRNCPEACLAVFADNLKGKMMRSSQYLVCMEATIFPNRYCAWSPLVASRRKQEGEAHRRRYIRIGHNLQDFESIRGKPEGNPLKRTNQIAHDGYYRMYMGLQVDEMQFLHLQKNCAMLCSGDMLVMRARAEFSLRGGFGRVASRPQLFFASGPFSPPLGHVVTPPRLRRQIQVERYIAAPLEYV
jgi:hypothetical protein